MAVEVRCLDKVCDRGDGSFLELIMGFWVVKGVRLLSFMSLLSPQFVFALFLIPIWIPFAASAKAAWFAVDDWENVPVKEVENALACVKGNFALSTIESCNEVRFAAVSAGNLSSSTSVSVSSEVWFFEAVVSSVARWFALYLG